MCACWVMASSSRSAKQRRRWACGVDCTEFGRPTYGCQQCSLVADVHSRQATLASKVVLLRGHAELRSLALSPLTPGLLPALFAA